MNKGDNQVVEYIFADESIKKEWVKKSQWDKEVIQQHMHLKNGFSIVAKIGGDLVSMISVYWNKLEEPIPETLEGYIDIIEVVKEYRGRGIARVNLF
ncbi:hypothetical protein BBF96_00560 [Anoxybacter fermentans]|uniref:N-acetyltransferase domain-containing protein n=1 Tax=Anoxybacter fermentans TaxID=1323375 RepID=A0A3S9SUM9_9FIRM|nr:GNAT family N-acetyltransferase [Anoxybacter fermentans]AZR72027.1 hypothetical protein BBF96_00560 [Anoxybacter fermentans]